MKTMLSLIIVCTVSGMYFVPTDLWAQGDQSCAFCMCIADSSCSTTACNNFTSTGDCAITAPFTVPCGGDYHIRWLISCPSGVQDGYCCIMFKLTGDDGYLYQSHTTCTLNDSTETDPDGARTLSTGVHYRLYACKRSCDPDHYTCSDKCAGCVMRVYLYRSNFSTDCWGIPACNP
jgi:hypothetical protein